MRSRPSLIALALAVLAVPVLVGCTASTASSPAYHAAASRTSPAASHPPPTGPIGSPGHPLLMDCAQESFTVPPVSYQPQPGDLVIGPLDIGNVLRLATANPADYGDHGSYKIPFILTPGSTATLTIASPARGQVVIDSPPSPTGTVTAATYHSCSDVAGFFAQGFTFTGGKIRGCVPLDVTIGQDTRVHHVTLSLFAGRCAS